MQLRCNMNDLIQASVGDAMSWSNIEDAEVVESLRYAKSASGRTRRKLNDEVATSLACIQDKKKLLIFLLFRTACIQHLA
jgi:hypothetical protein